MIEALNGMVIRAIDLGYGNVKSTLRHDDLRSPIECDIFPSRSPAANDKGLSAGVIKGRETVFVNVKGSMYEVGHDVGKAQGAYDESSVLDKDFCLSDAYLARCLGALYYMKGKDKNGRSYMTGSQIDLLVVGLPVSIYRNKTMPLQLKKILTGLHDLPDGRSVNVVRVLVLPQPLGAYFEYAFDNGMFDQMNEQRNLIIDPGFFTFDWLMADGLKIIDARSHSVNRGMSPVLLAIAEAIMKDKGFEDDTNMFVRMLDDYFREGKPFMPYGKLTDVTQYLDSAKSIIEQAVSSLIGNIGSVADVQNIILTGGGANLYLDALKEKFPRHEILVMENPVFSNVRGFQLCGELQIIKQNRKSSQAEFV